MGKHVPKIKVKPGPQPWFYELEFEYRPGLVDELSKIPGANFDWIRKRWSWPVEMLELLKEIANRHGFELDDRVAVLGDRRA